MKMKKIILATVATMLSMQAWGEVKLQPTQVLKAKAYVYKFKDTDKADGTIDRKTTEICKVDVFIPSFKGRTNTPSDWSFGKGHSYCHTQILGQDVTIAFGTLHDNILLEPGEITNEYGLNAWINTRANLIIGMTYFIPGKAKPEYDKKSNELNWNNEGMTAEQYMSLQDLLPKNQSSMTVFRGDIHQGFSTLMDFDNSDICNKISDSIRQEKCREDGFFRVNIVYEGKK